MFVEEAKLADHSFMADSPVYKDSKTLNDAVRDRRRRQDALYGARFVLMGLLCVIGFLACAFTRWSTTCDKRLHRLVSYIDSTVNACQVGWVADPLSSPFPVLYANADFAGCMNTQRSNIGLPAFEFWQKLLPHARNMWFLETNQAMLQCCQSGRDPTMIHLLRAHRVSVTWIHEQYELRDFMFTRGSIAKRGHCQGYLGEACVGCSAVSKRGGFSPDLFTGYLCRSPRGPSRPSSQRISRGMRSMTRWDLLRSLHGGSRSETLHVHAVRGGIRPELWIAGGPIRTCIIGRWLCLRLGVLRRGHAQAGKPTVS